MSKTSVTRSPGATALVTDCRRHRQMRGLDVAAAGPGATAPTHQDAGDGVALLIRVLEVPRADDALAIER